MYPNSECKSTRTKENDINIQVLTIIESRVRLQHYLCATRVSDPNGALSAMATVIKVRKLS